MLVKHVLETPVRMPGVFTFVTMRLLLFSISLIALVFCSSFLAPRKAPAGTSPVSGLTNTFLDKTEVTNKAWRDYLEDIRRKGDSAAYEAALPDLAVWEMAYSNDFTEKEAFNDYPVVGISFQQAKDYCKWRTQHISSKERRRITFSLPSQKVYKLTLNNEDSNKIAEGLYSTNLGFRTFLGLCDNAGEMTNKEGKAIQGSDREDCLDVYEYFTPSHKLGFRCMAKL